MGSTGPSTDSSKEKPKPKPKARPKPQPQPGSLPPRPRPQPRPVPPKRTIPFDLDTVCPGDVVWELKRYKHAEALYCALLMLVPHPNPTQRKSFNDLDWFKGGLSGRKLAWKKILMVCLFSFLFNVNALLNLWSRYIIQTRISST